MAGTCKGENTSSSWRQDFSPDHWSLAANTSRKRPWFRDCSFWVFRYRFWGAQNERDCDSTRSIQTKTEANLHYGKFDWLDSLGTPSSGSTGVKKKTLFLVSAFFFFLEIFPECFTLNCSPSKLQCSKDNCVFFSDWRSCLVFKVIALDGLQCFVL